MKTYKPYISLSKNGRGIWDLDTTKGCNSGMSLNPNGCYNDCYAAKTAKRYGIDFSKTVLRTFKNESHKQLIINEIKKIDMPFIRIGCSGDPSENWQHTLDVIGSLKDNQVNLFDFKAKKIVIITRHWQKLTDNQLIELKKYNVVINTTVSPLDNVKQIINSLNEYERLKPFCKSVLRVVTAKFNTENREGYIRDNLQKFITGKGFYINTVFRPSLNNRFVKENIIITKKEVFNGSKQLASKNNKKAYMGKCKTCKDGCGI